MSERQHLTRIRIWLGLFVAGLLIAGITAFPLEWEASMVSRWLHGSGAWAGTAFPALRAWLDEAARGFAVSHRLYPWLAYGTDWLAFGHITIAVALSFGVIGISPLFLAYQHIRVLETARGGWR